MFYIQCGYLMFISMGNLRNNMISLEFHRIENDSMCREGSTEGIFERIFGGWEG
jgi:hypothetical protein